MSKNGTLMLVLAGLVAISAMAPTPARAQTILHWVNRQLHVDDHYDLTHHHPAWRRLNYSDRGNASVGIITDSQEQINFGITGGMYSTYRYQQDSKSNNPTDRERYTYYRQASRKINGNPYHRVILMSNGHHYYAYKQD